MSNMKLWNSVRVTDPSAVKKITGKQYQGNSPKPYWIIQRATETFGPCGIGWGVEVVNERFERFGDEALHVALVRVWFEQDGKRGVIEQMGQTKAAYTSAAGKHIVDEDAPKKSVTDGMVKCLSMIGFAGDIFSGQWDDSKYVEWAGDQYAPKQDVAAILKGIANSTNMDLLKTNFTHAMQMLDSEHHAAVTSAKDKRKKELSQKQECALEAVADQAKYQ